MAGDGTRGGAEEGRAVVAVVTWGVVLLHRRTTMKQQAGVVGQVAVGSEDQRAPCFPSRAAQMVAAVWLRMLALVRLRVFRAR